MVNGETSYHDQFCPFSRDSSDGLNLDGFERINPNRSIYYAGIGRRLPILVVNTYDSVRQATMTGFVLADVRDVGEYI